MYLNSFSVRVPEGTEKESGYVELNHGKQYTLVLRNSRGVSCDAEVTIDGKPIGSFRIDANSSITLERPPNEDKRFTFYKADTGDAQESGQADIVADSYGLVQVAFKAEKANLYFWHDGTWPKPWGEPIAYQHTWTTYTTPSYSPVVAHNVMRSTLSDSPSGQVEILSTTDGGTAGITGLSGHSDQEFVTVCSMDYDESYTTTISIRLVATEKQRSDPTPLRPVAHSNPVPPTVYA